jgi:hypothetical protein
LMAIDDDSSPTMVQRRRAGRVEWGKPLLYNSAVGLNEWVWENPWSRRREHT